MDSLWKDTRVAFRVLRKHPAFALTAIVTLALGIGASTAIFSVVNAVLLRPLPYTNPDRLAIVWGDMRNRNVTNFPMSPADFRDLRATTKSFSELAGLSTFKIPFAGDGYEPEQVPAAFVTTNLFSVLGAHVIMGRDFVDADATPQPPPPNGANAGQAAPQGPRLPAIMILSYEFFKRRYGGDASIIGKSLELGGLNAQVVGVAQPGFELLFTPAAGIERTPDVYVAQRINFGDNSPASRINVFLRVVGRLAPGVTLVQARQEIDAFAASLRAQFPIAKTAGLYMRVEPMHADLVSTERPAILALMGAVAFVLLIACINVAGLLLARAAARSRELAVRRALGASRGRLTAQYLTEGAVLAAPGAFGALLLAHWCTAALARLAPDGMLSGYRLGLDARVLTFTVAVTLLVVALFSLVPALSGSALGLANTLRDEGRGTSAGRTKQRARRVLVASEIALALVLTTGAGLLARSFANVLKVDPGFTPAHLLTFHIAFPSYRYPKASRVIDAEQALVDSLAQLPGARSATATVNLPTLGGWQIAFSPEGEALPKVPIASNFVVLRDYFQTMGIPVVKGRAFDARDEASSGNVAIIDERLAHQFYGERNPIGLRIKWGAPQSTDPWKTIVGVVRTVPTRGLDQTSPPELYFPARQLAVDSTFVDAALRELTFVVRTERDPLALAPRVQRLVRSIDPQLVVAKVQTVESLVSESVASRRFDLLLIGAFAVLAVLLAAVGLSGLVAYSVVQRQREIGVRLAIGSTQNGIVGLVLRDGLTTAVWGSAFGIAGAFALTRLMRSLLFGVGTLDATTFLATTTILIAVAAFASWLPARRAARIDPMVAIRQE